MICSSRPVRAGGLAVVADAVRSAVELSFAQIIGEKPAYEAEPPPPDQRPGVAGILSFVGDVCWTLTLVLGAEAAPAVAQKFTGMDIPFDSPDMGDVAGELVNVLAGEVIAQLEARRVRSKMGLPTVARGAPLEFLPDKGVEVTRLDFRSACGRFWLRVATSAQLPP